MIVPAADPGALRAALERLMGDPSLRRKLGEAGRRRVEEEFALTRLRDRLGALYRELGLLTEGAAC